MQRTSSTRHMETRILLPTLRTNTRTRNGGTRMKIIHHGNIRINLKTYKEYKIKTPIGVFTDINDAVQVYPELNEIKRIKQCPQCEKYFIDNSRQNNRKYCTNKCSEEYKKIYKNIYNSAWQRDKWLRTKNNTIINDKEHRSENWEFRQDDNFWGLGESNLHEHRNPDEEYEHNIIRKELNRILHRKDTQTQKYNS